MRGCSFIEALCSPGEREAQSVELTFYQLSTSEWNNKLSTFKTLVAAEAVTYCTNNAATCGISSGFLFTASLVGVLSGPTEESKSVKVKFYIDFPTLTVVSAASTTSHVVNSAAVSTIITNIREDVENGVGADMTYIGEEFYSIDPDSTANKVIIPIAFIILIAIIVLAIALHVWNKRKEKEEKKKLKALEREKRKKTSRVVPVFTQETEAPRAKASWLRTLRKKKEASFRQGSANGYVPTLSMKTNMMTHNSSHAAGESVAAIADAAAAPEYQDPVTLNSNALHPLPDPEAETQEQREKREKKEKRRRKREKRQRSAKKDAAEDESESEYSKTESLEKTLEKNIVPVEFA
ncbi:hypothetical protein ACOMHN_056894 [Nucella lapillus]